MEKNTLIKKLKKSGLPEKTAIVYASLFLMGGEGFPSAIAKEASLNRSTVYKILTDLSIKGLVGEIEKSNKLYYQIEKPSKIKSWADNYLAIVKNQKEYVDSLVPELEDMYAEIGHKTTVRYFKGREGLLSIYKEHISGKGNYKMLAFSNTTAIKDFLTKEFLKKYIEQKEKKNITSRGIIPNTQEDKSYAQDVYAHVKKSIRPKIRWIPSEMFPFKSEIVLYENNKISIVNIKESVLSGIIIEDQEIYNMMKMIFELSWLGSKKYEK